VSLCQVGDHRAQHPVALFGVGWPIGHKETGLPYLREIGIFLIAGFQQKEGNVCLSLFRDQAARDQPVTAVVARTDEHRDTGFGIKFEDLLDALRNRTPGVVHHLRITDARFIGGSFHRAHFFYCQDFDHYMLHINENRQWTDYSAL
jgi:hypothetical protein